MNLTFNKLIDLTHTLNSTSICWDNDCGFKQHLLKDYETDGCRVHSIEMFAGVGTHMDAPAHFVANARDIASIPLEKLIVTAHVIDISQKCQADYFANLEDLIAYENKWGQITENSLVIFHTGWNRYWNRPQQYRNADDQGIFRIPGIDISITEALLQRNINGIAIDTLSPDGSNMQFPVHHLLLNNDKYIIENITNADQLPAVGSHVIMLPLKIEHGTESPLRIVAAVN